MASPSENTLILGLAAGYHYQDVRPFLASLDDCGFSGECVLFTTDTTRDTQRMAAHGARIVPFRRTAGREHLSHNAYRYFLYRDHLRRFDTDYRRILLTDVRDVLFQSDPMAADWSPGLNVTLEDRRMTVGRCPFNSLWVRHHLGDAALREIADRPVSCSGTTVGDRHAMLNYLKALTARLEPYSPAEMTAGYDQGVHNYLLHTGALGEVTTHDNSGPILTLAYRKGEPQTDNKGRVLNDSGVPAVIVHQYDRKPELFGQIRSRYA